MKTWILTYFEIGSKGELIMHKEEYPTKISAAVNEFFAKRDPKKINVKKFKEEK